MYLRAFICVYSPFEGHLLLRNLHFTAQAFSVSAFLATLWGLHQQLVEHHVHLVVTHCGDCLIFGIIDETSSGYEERWLGSFTILLIIVLRIEGSVLSQKRGVGVARPVGILRGELLYGGLHTFTSCSVLRAVIFSASVLQKHRLHSFFCWNTASFVRPCCVKKPQPNPPLCFENPSPALLRKWFCSSVSCKTMP